jgi:hypothetical protein
MKYSVLVTTYALSSKVPSPIKRCRSDVFMAENFI